MKRNQFLKTTAGITLGLAAAPALLGAQKSKITTPGKSMKPKVIRNGEGEVRNILGDPMNIKLTGAETRGQYVWVEQPELTPGTGIPPHVHHKEDEVFKVIKGKIEFMIGEEKVVLGPGDIAYAPKNVPHAWKVVSEEPAALQMSAYPAGIENLFRKLSELPPGPPDFEKVVALSAEHNIEFL